MKKRSGKTVLIIVVLLIAVLAAGGIRVYNKMVSGQEKVQGAFADIDAQLQRRADLIPNLISAVKGYMEHESAVLTAVTESRERLLNAGTPAEKAEANDALADALSRLNIVVESYPDLKASSNFVQLQDELAGTENRIAVARRDYNAAVREYNQIIKKLPGSLFASGAGFEPAEYFTANETSSEVPNVEF